MPDINSLEQNPVDYYNHNHFEDALQLLLTTNKTLRREGKKIIEEFNVGESKEVYKIKAGHFIVIEQNNLGLIKDLQYSPFQILTRFKFRNNFNAAYYHVGMTYMDMNFPYIRVGVKYFKIVHKTDRFGIKREELNIWSKDEIKQDYGKDMLDRVMKFDDFTIEPNNSDYQKVVNGHYNLYSPFPHQPIEFDIENDIDKIKWSMKLMNHIFGEQIEQGLKYCKILYENPKQALPILVPVSEERQTGKSTFVDWQSIVFGGNMVIINPQDISSSFNSSYATKNIIAIEESRFESVQATEKLKALATQKTLLVNTKFVTPYNTPFYAKLIITSNDESKFSKVDEAEIRYWVRRIGTIKGVGNHAILDDLRDEIPYFLYYLSQLSPIDFTKSRQVFTSEEIDTGALKTVKHESRPELQKEIEILITEFFENNQNKQFIEFSASDIKDAWFSNNNNYSRAYIIKVLKVHMKLNVSDISKRYAPFHLNEDFPSKTGKIYTIENPNYSGQKSLIEDNDESNVPF